MNNRLSLNILLALVALVQVSMAEPVPPIDDPWDRLELAVSEMKNEGFDERCYNYFSIIENDDPMTAEDLIEYGRELDVPKDKVYPFSASLKAKGLKLIMENRISKREDPDMYRVRKDLIRCLSVASASYKKMRLQKQSDLAGESASDKI